MKNKDFIVMAISSLLLLGFVVYMLLYSFKNSKLDLIREDLKNDSIIFKQNNELMYDDSIMESNYEGLENAVDNHEYRIKVLENRKPIIRRDTIVVVNE